MRFGEVETKRDIYASRFGEGSPEGMLAVVGRKEVVGRDASGGEAEGGMVGRDVNGGEVERNGGQGCEWW